MSKQKKQKTKICVDCSAEYPMTRGRKTRCDPCQEEYAKEWRRQYHKKDMYKRRQEKYNQRTKDDIGLLSENYMVGLGTINFQQYEPDFEKEFRIIRRLGQGIIKRD